MEKIATSAFESAAAGYEAWQMPTIRARDGLVINSHDKDLEDELLRIPEFQKQLEQLRESARSEGFNLGKEQGYRQGLNQGKTEIQLIGDRLNNLVENLSEPVKQQDEALENALLNMVVSIARQVVTEEAVRSPESLRGVIQTAIKALPRGSENISVFLNPLDKKLLAAVGALPNSNQELLVDETLARGGCRVETHESTVDFGLEYRFRQAVAQQINKQYSSEVLGVLSESVELPNENAAVENEPDPSADAT
ncbi:MAG: hypothetical protein JKX83_09670 [Pseudomonadales bacterium]|nr:hypothetical protein [Pseudomonadales bacterium]